MAFKPEKGELEEMLKALKQWEGLPLFGVELQAASELAVKALCAHCDNAAHAITTVNQLAVHSGRYPTPLDIRSSIDSPPNLPDAPRWTPPPPPTDEERAEIKAAIAEVHASIRRARQIPQVRGADPVPGEEYTPEELRLQLAQQRKIINGEAAATKRKAEIAELERRFGKIPGKE